jgi:anti-sigma B factor antagonist
MTSGSPGDPGGTLDVAIDRRTEGNWTVLTVAGELDLATGPALRDVLSATESSRIAVELSEVTFMDSSSLGILVAALKHAREQGGELVLIGVGGPPAKVFALTGLDDVFPMVRDAGELDTLG